MTTVVNGAFRPQRVSGQQRYAREIADRLVGRPGFHEVGPSGRWSGSALREWAWTLGRLPVVAGRKNLLSLTARAPLRRRQTLVVHDLFVLTDPQWYSKKYIATHAPLLRAQIRHSDALVAVSAPVAEQISDLAGRSASIAPNAPSTVFSQAGPDDAAAREKRGLTEDGYLLVVGSMDARKNLARLAEAYGLVDASTREEMPLVVVGGSADIYRAGRLDWPAGAMTVGYVSDEELRGLYAGARAVVFPSLAEGFGLPLVEAVAAGARSLVVSDIPVFRWICGDGAAYVDPTSVESIREGLDAAISGVTPAARLQRAFDWDQSAAVVAETCVAAAGGSAA